MSNILVVNSTRSETRVALIEDGLLSEIYMERRRDRGVAGNIYKGKVLRVLPGMQAAFVDVAQEKAGFLHVSDFYNFEKDINLLEEDGDQWPPPSRGKISRKINISDCIKEGQEVLVQVAKEPMGTKGARLTGHISLPGRYVVFMPTVSHVGISRRIESEKERKRLRKLVEENRPPGTGFIVRTVSENISEDKLVRDMQLLVKLWTDILDKANQVKAPYLLNEEPDLLLRAARDLFTTDVGKLIVDDEEAYKRVSGFTKHYMPSFADNIEMYGADEPIFDAYGIEVEIDRALAREVPLPSGGSLVFDKTEALTAVDVNTGKFVGSGSDLEETILRTNLEAAEEVVYQLRLRNIGGIIIIDFIDMEDARNREKVYRTLEAALKKDRVTTNSLAISEFGLVEMTRKRVRESLVQYMCDPCERCKGLGHVKSAETVSAEIVREIRREARAFANKDVYVEANADVVSYMLSAERKTIQDLEKTFEKKIHLRGQRDKHPENFEIADAK
ncbi:Rne/Rng family ribonuclease [Lujinxingia vulgaris]|uniref:Ribonuclease G n=1 Tax=Lujinxingia vulgaris TaxID=2600176 RepID=A0A5C6XFA6_9DELT|nr:Rne/Rng family ribonuclease [Lujinxingia vulgaris]TXD36109.1 Rne/Rng family ribonuclease [Lujinxingia vulgaris]